MVISPRSPISACARPHSRNVLHGRQRYERAFRSFAMQAGSRLAWTSTDELTRTWIMRVPIDLLPPKSLQGCLTPSYLQIVEVSTGAPPPCSKRSDLRQYAKHITKLPYSGNTSLPRSGAAEWLAWMTNHRQLAHA